jgi:hypothetical protein
MTPTFHHFLAGAFAPAEHQPESAAFAQGSVGLYHCGVCDINDFALQVGGGLDWRARRSSDLRIRTQLDFRHMFDDFDDFNAVRLAVGVVFPLNK